MKRRDDPEPRAPSTADRIAPARPPSEQDAQPDFSPVRDSDNFWHAKASPLLGRSSGRFHQTPAEAARTPGRFRATSCLRVPVYPCLGFVAAREKGIDYFSNPAQHLTGPGCRRTAYPPKWQTVEPWVAIGAADYPLKLTQPSGGVAEAYISTSCEHQLHSW